MTPTWLREEREAVRAERDQRRERAERFGAPTEEEVTEELEKRCKTEEE
jgi:hypothetical protein